MFRPGLYSFALALVVPLLVITNGRQRQVLHILLKNLRQANEVEGSRNCRNLAARHVIDLHHRFKGALARWVRLFQELYLNASRQE